MVTVDYAVAQFGLKLNTRPPSFFLVLLVCVFFFAYCKMFLDFREQQHHSNTYALDIVTTELQAVIKTLGNTKQSKRLTANSHET